MNQKRVDYGKSEFSITNELTNKLLWKFPNITERSDYLTEKALKHWKWDEIISEPKFKLNTHWITSIRDDENESAIEIVQKLVEENKLYAFGESTYRNTGIGPGDKICFYAAGKGVVADAKVASYPKNKSNNVIRNSDLYPWVFDLTDCNIYVNTPIVIDKNIRSQLKAFNGRDMNNWGWFVQYTHEIDQDDFKQLILGE